eukprot:TRINITY_DN2908_c0_g3_i6.p1 TRINITY_DN2908_c0_g3~~TRINITY_DN2908_c0_g3_i6.p1  ORF type:complete len:184 (-),score=63.83 TRINITY_DN2908_c0_g3_i6:147-698(-)
MKKMSCLSPFHVFSNSCSAIPASPPHSHKNFKEKSTEFPSESSLESPFRHRKRADSHNSTLSSFQSKESAGKMVEGTSKNGHVSPSKRFSFSGLNLFSRKSSKSNASYSSGSSDQSAPSFSSAASASSGSTVDSPVHPEKKKEKKMVWKEQIKEGQDDGTYSSKFNNKNLQRCQRNLSHSFAF